MEHIILYKIAEIAAQNKTALIYISIFAFVLAALILAIGFRRCIKGMNDFDKTYSSGGLLIVALGIILVISSSYVLHLCI